MDTENPLSCDCDLSWLIRNATLLSVVDGVRCDGDGVAIKNVNLTEFHHCATVNAVWPSPLTRIGSEVEAEPEAEAEAEAEPETEAGVDANAEAI